MNELAGTLSSAVPAALAAVIGSLLTFLATRTKLVAEARKANTEAAVLASREWQRISSEYREQTDAQDAQIQDLTQRLEKQESLLASQNMRLYKQEERNNRLTTDLREVFRWIESGQPPPPPTRPAYL